MPFTKKNAKDAARKRWDKTPLITCPKCGHVHRCVADPKPTKRKRLAAKLAAAALLLALSAPAPASAWCWGVICSGPDGLGEAITRTQQLNANLCQLEKPADSIQSQCKQLDSIPNAVAACRRDGTSRREYLQQIDYVVTAGQMGCFSNLSIDQQEQITNIWSDTVTGTFKCGRAIDSNAWQSCAAAALAHSQSRCKDLAREAKE